MRVSAALPSRHSRTSTVAASRRACGVSVGPPFGARCGREAVSRPSVSGPLRLAARRSLMAGHSHAQKAVIAAHAQNRADHRFGRNPSSVWPTMAPIVRKPTSSVPPSKWRVEGIRQQPTPPQAMRPVDRSHFAQGAATSPKGTERFFFAREDRRGCRLAFARGGPPRGRTCPAMPHPKSGRKWRTLARRRRGWVLLHDDLQSAPASSR
jgi:hypothetical protein